MSEPPQPPNRPAIPPASAEDEELKEILVGPSLEESQQSLEFWRKRLDTLPRYKRAERREARQSIATWQQRADAARRERYGPTMIEQLLAIVGIRRLPTRAIARGITAAAIVVIVLVILLIVALVAFWHDISPIIHDVLQQGGDNGG